MIFQGFPSLRLECYFVNNQLSITFPDVFFMASSRILLSSFFIYLLLWCAVQEVEAQRRSRTVTTGTMRIELLGRSAVNQATIHLYLNDTLLVATQSVKKDSAADRSRLTTIQNLEPGTYTLRIEAPGKPLMEKMAYVRAERTPVKMYLDFPAGRGFAGEETDQADIETLYNVIADLEQRIFALEAGRSTSSTPSTRVQGPSPRTTRQIQRERENLPDSVAAPQEQPEQEGWFKRWWRGSQNVEPEPEEPRLSRRERRRQERAQSEQPQAQPATEQSQNPSDS